MIDFQAVLIVCSSVFLNMNLLFLLAVILKKNDIVDISWGLGFILITGLFLILVPEYSLRRLLVSAFVIIWGFRLAIYIFIRNKGKKEDFRYAQWKKE